MKQTIKEEINKLYCLFKTTPKIDVQSVKQHVESFAFNTQQINPLRKAVNEVVAISKKKKIIVTKSTVPVATGDEIEKIIKKRKKKNIVAISNPEFLREGEAIRDFRYPDRIVIGSNDKKIHKIMKSLYIPLINKGAKFFTTSRRGAELIKYASNAFLATKITFINEIANLCE